MQLENSIQVVGCYEVEGDQIFAPFEARISDEKGVEIGMERYLKVETKLVKRRW
jgi:hypothetical protein